MSSNAELLLPTEFVPGSRGTLQYTGYRFWKRVRRGEGCWEWTGPLARGGYGLFGSPLVPSKRAHRVAWYLAIGPIPEGLEVCHHCDNRLCCRPSHLFLGTRTDNNRDMHRKGRGNSWGRRGRYGEQASSHKLTELQAREILERKRAGATTNSLVREFGVSKTTIRKIANGQLWPHLQVPA